MYKCSCKRWKKSGIKYDGEEFEYCPWCGKKLVIVYAKLLRDYEHNAT